jgi:hypothetical protein
MYLHHVNTNRPVTVKYRINQSILLYIYLSACVCERERTHIYENSDRIRTHLRRQNFSVCFLCSLLHLKSHKGSTNISERGQKRLTFTFTIYGEQGHHFISTQHLPVTKILHREHITKYTSLHTNSTEQSPSWKADSRAVSQKIPRSLFNLKVHCCVHNSPSLVPIVSQMHPINGH